MAPEPVDRSPIAPGDAAVEPAVESPTALDDGHEPGDDSSSAAGGVARASRLARLSRALVTAPIAVYQRVISPAIPRRCKYEPTCSRYAVEAIRQYGILKGAVLAGWRLLRCNPWSYGGYDPVEAQRVFPVGHRSGV